MGFFNNIGVTPPTKDNIYSLFSIPEICYRYYGKVQIMKTSTGIRISIDNEMYSIKGTTYVSISESNDYDTGRIVNFLIKKQLCVEDIQEIRLYLTTKSREYAPGILKRIFRPDDIAADIVLKNELTFRIDISPIEM